MHPGKHSAPERPPEPRPALSPAVAPDEPPEGRRPGTTGAMTLGMALATLGFWMIAIAKFLGNIGTQALHVHQAAFLVDHGSTPRLAATVVSVVGAASMVGKIGGGWLSDVLRREVVYVLGMASVIAGIGIFLLLYIAFNNLRNLALTFLNLPFALIGGVCAVLFATGGWMSLGSLVGFVTLFGITLRNSIMLVSHYQHLVEAEGHPWGPETALLGAAERLPSILMTALVTGLALFSGTMPSG